MINIYLLQKAIDNNNCWIPHIKPLKDGYVQVTINQIRYKLHRLSMCISRKLDYDDKSFETRHANKCNRACFNPEHLTPGTAKENSNDMIMSGNHNNLRKNKCKYCNREYTTKTIKTGAQRGRTYRYCRHCEHRGRVAI